MTRLGGASNADTLAYVDGRLAGADRVAFERRIAEDPQLAKRVDQWFAQNDAIRAAYGEPNGGPGKDDPVAATLAPDRAGIVRIHRDVPRRSPPAARSSARVERLPVASTPLAQDGRAAGARPRLARALVALLGALLICVASVNPWPSDRSERLLSAATTAYRTFAADHIRAVELATGDAGALQRWLRPQFGRAVPVPDLASAGFTLLGGRVIPGADSPAAFAIYENAAHERAGLAIETSDSPPTSNIVVQRRGDLAASYMAGPGFDFALVMPGQEADAVQPAFLLNALTQRPR